jgi:hypothetical protein
MRNITVCVPEPMYRRARVYAAQHGISLSAAVQFLLENLSAVSRAVRKLLEADPNFGKAAASARSSIPPAADKNAISGL